MTDRNPQPSSEQRTVVCYCTCPDCWHGCCHVPLWDLTDEALDALYERRDLAEGALARVQAVLDDPDVSDWRQRLRDALQTPTPKGARP